MEKRNFGTTGIKVSALGFGAGQIGAHQLDEKSAEHILNSAVDLGITLFDTARGYGLSEERIGKYLSSKREQIVLSTKVGYGIPGFQDWSYDGILAGIDEALKLLKTDYIDIVHLHSCPTETMRNNSVIDALEKAKSDMKILVAGYAGENEPLNFAIDSNRFGSILSSVNIFDQRILNFELPKAKQHGMGVIAKRPVANAPWKFSEQPHGNYCEEYWLRMKKMNIQSDLDWNELALRFSVFTYGVDSCIVGTTNSEHLKHNAEIIQKGKLPDDLIHQIRESFMINDNNWVGQL